MVDPTLYVVLDVETNGLSSINDDLLSISIYKPDDKKVYNRFLPLDLSRDVYTTVYNGITKKMLKGATPLTQSDVDEIISDFELDRRIILTYGSLDEKFIKNYFKRKGLQGYSVMKFHNFKHDIISSSFSPGNITKDNLCRIFGVEGITEVHSGLNDCILEWELFCCMDGEKLFISHDRVYVFSSDYIIPTSYLSTYPNFKYVIKSLPKIKVRSSLIYELTLSQACSKAIKKYETNISGMTIEHLIYSMLSVREIDSEEFLFSNKQKLKYLGNLPSMYNIIPAIFNTDGTISAVREEDQERVRRINKTTLRIKAEIAPLIEFIKSVLFQGKEILSQELVVNTEAYCCSLCDLSNECSVLEIKTSSSLDLGKHKIQLFYQANGRDTYVLQIDWGYGTGVKRFLISKIEFDVQYQSSCKAIV